MPGLLALKAVRRVRWALLGLAGLRGAGGKRSYVGFDQSFKDVLDPFSDSEIRLTASLRIDALNASECNAPID